MPFSDDDIASLADDFQVVAGPEIRTPRAYERQRGGNAGFSHVRPDLSPGAGVVAGQRALQRFLGMTPTAPLATREQAARLKALHGTTTDLAQSPVLTKTFQSVRRRRNERAARAREIQRHRNLLRLEKRTPGSYRTTRKLSATAVLKIREIWAAGFLSQAELGRKFGVSQAAISAIVHGDTWRDVTPCRFPFTGTRGVQPKRWTPADTASIVEKLRALRRPFTSNDVLRLAGEKCYLTRSRMMQCLEGLIERVGVEDRCGRTEKRGRLATLWMVR